MRWYLQVDRPSELDDPVERHLSRRSIKLDGISAVAESEPIVMLTQGREHITHQWVIWFPQANLRGLFH
jgi:hypothetical protein